MVRKLTSAGCLAVTAMIDLALRTQGGPATIAAISRRQQVSTSYLELVFSRLRRHRLVQAVRGPGGGYLLGRDAAQISVADIIVAVDKPEGAAGRHGHGHGGDGAAGSLGDQMLAGLNSRLLECLQSISLQDLVNDQIGLDVPARSAPLRRGISSVPVVKPIRITGPNSVFALAGVVAK